MNQNDARDSGLAVEVASTRFDPRTDRAKAAAMDLVNELEREFGDALPKPEKSAKSKGDPVTVGAIILALITSGAVVKMLDVVKAWIQKDPEDRELRVKGTAGGKEIDLTVTAKNVDDEKVAEIISAVAGT